MYTHLFSKKRMAGKVTAGVVASLFAFATLFASFPASFAHAAGLDPVTVTGYAEDSSKTTLGVGDQFIVALNYQQSQNDLVIDPNGACTVNGKDVKSTLQNFNDGTFQLVYTVAAGDQNAAAGQIVFSCSLKDSAGNQGVLTGYSTPNNVAIDTGSGNTGGNTGTGTGTTTDTGGNTGGNTGDNTGGNTTGTTTPTALGYFSVKTIPNSGTLGVGNTLTIDIQELNNESDISMVGDFCKINNVEVNNFQNLGGGHYTVTHTYSANDANIDAGQLTFSCNVKNSSGMTGVLQLSDPNTVAIHTQTNDNNNGLPPAGTFQVTADPSTGTLNPGDMVIVRANDSGGITDFAVDPNGMCTINGKYAGTTFQAFGDHTYQMTYTVAQGDPAVPAGQLAVSCAVKNPSGVTATISGFTDHNTLAIAGGGATTTTGTTTNTGGNNNGTSTNTTGGNNNGTSTNTTGGNNNNNGGTTGTTTTATSSEQSGDLNGNVEGGTNNQDNGVLEVTHIDQIKSVATADGDIVHGWKWIFHITVPSNEPKLQLKFDNWMHTNGVNSISPANNMRISSNEIQGGPVMVTGTNVYTSPVTVTGDLNASMPGKQIEVTVEAGVPVGSTNGSYTNTYHVKSTPNS